MKQIIIIAIMLISSRLTAQIDSSIIYYQNIPTITFKEGDRIKSIVNLDSSGNKTFEIKYYDTYNSYFIKIEKDYKIRIQYNDTSYIDINGIKNEAVIEENNFNTATYNFYKSFDKKSKLSKP